MKTTSLRARAIACALLATTATCGLTAAPAQAQALPAFRNLDANGVDLTRGDVVLSFVEGSIGSGEGELAIVRRRGSGNATQWDDISLERYQSGGTTTVYVNLGHESEMFTGTGTTLTSTKANGGTLSGSYIYRAADGSTISFADPTLHQMGGATNFCLSATNQSSCRLLPETIASPDGKTVNLEWTTTQRCQNFTNPDGSVDCEYFWRLKSVTNSFGYGIGFTYAAEDGGGSYGQAPADAWSRRTSAALYNSVAGSGQPATVGYAYPASNITEVTDMAGRTWRFTTGTGMLAIRRPGASSDSTVYTSGANGVTSVLRDGVTTHYSRAVSGSTVAMTVTNALNQASTIISDLTIGRPTSVKDALNRTTSFSYEPGTARVKRVTAPEGNFVEYSYDGRGNVTQVLRRDKSGNPANDIVTSATYAASCLANPSCNQPLTTTDARGNVTDYTYDDTHGGLLAVTGPAPTPGAVRPQRRFLYTLVNGEYQLTGVSACQTQAGSFNGNPAACAGGDDEVKTTLAYDANGNVTGISSGNGSGTLTAPQTMTYDAKGDLLTVDGPLAGTADTTRLRYNAARELIGTVSPDPDGAGALKHRAVRNIIDGSARLIKTEQGTVNSQSDADWAAFAPLEAVEIGYDASHRPITQKLTAGGAAHALTQTSYDAVGRPECVAQRMNTAVYGALPASACSLGTQGSFGPDRIAKTIYDAAGQVTQVKTALGITGQEANEVTSTYRPNGQVETVTDAENNRTTYEYDGHDRLAKTRFPSPTKGMGVSSTTDYEQLGYDAASNVTSFRNRANQMLFFTYDALNRLTFKDLPNTATLEADVTYGYDLLGRLTLASDTNGYQGSFSYDALGRRLTEGSNWYGTKSSAYDLAGRRTRLTHRDGFFIDYDYLVTGETTRIRENGATSGAGVLATFGYDNLGRRVSLTRGNGTSTSYAYDPASRLSQLAQSLPADTARNLTLGFSYDPASRIISNTRSNAAYALAAGAAGTVSSSVDGLNRLIGQGGTALSYDAKGNVTNDGSRSFSYTAENRMATGPSTNLIHDPLGRLYGVLSGGTILDYDGADLILETDQATGAQVKRRYVHGPGIDEPLVWYEGPGTGDRRYLHADERGSIVAVSNSAGTVTSVNSYDEYGAPGAANAGRFQYTGQAWLPELGLYYYKARMYNPRLPRFMQPDPIGYGNGMNIYAYVGGDPVNFTDPLGLTQVCIKANVGGDSHDGIVTVILQTICWDDRGSDGGTINPGGTGDGGDQGGVELASSKAKNRECPLRRPSAGMLNEATNSALSSIYEGKNNRPTTSPLNSEFSRLNQIPDFSKDGWRSVYSTHAGYAYERSIPGSGNVIKLYINDRHHDGLNTATITSPTSTISHYVDFLPYTLGGPVNARNAAVTGKEKCLMG